MVWNQYVEVRSGGSLPSGTVNVSPRLHLAEATNKLVSSLCRRHCRVRYNVENIRPDGERQRSNLILTKPDVAALRNPQCPFEHLFHLASEFDSRIHSPSPFFFGAVFAVAFAAVLATALAGTFLVGASASFTAGSLAGSLAGSSAGSSVGFLVIFLVGVFPALLAAALFAFLFSFFFAFFFAAISEALDAADAADVAPEVTDVALAGVPDRLDCVGPVGTSGVWDLEKPPLGCHALLAIAKGLTFVKGVLKLAKGNQRLGLGNMLGLGNQELGFGNKFGFGSHWPGLANALLFGFMLPVFPEGP